MELSHIKWSEQVWGLLDLLGCLGMLAFEMIAFWLLVPKH